MRPVPFVATVVLIGLGALGFHWISTDANSTPIAGWARVDAAASSVAAGDRPIPVLVTDRYRELTRPAVPRQTVRVQFVKEDEPRTVDVGAHGWISFDGRTLVDVRAGMSEPVSMPCGRVDTRLLLRGQVGGVVSFEVEPGRDVYTTATPWPSGFTLSGVATRDGRPVVAGKKVRIDLEGVSGLARDCWGIQHAVVETYENGFWFWHSNGCYYNVRAGVALVDREPRAWGPRPLLIERPEPWPGGKHWDLGEVPCESPPVLMRVHLTWPDDCRPMDTGLELTIRPPGARGDTKARFVCERPDLAGAALDVVGAVPWPTFDIEARCGKLRWRSNETVTAGEDVEIRFGVTGKIVGSIVWENPADRIAQVTVRSAAGAVRTAAVSRRVPDTRFSMAGLLPGRYIVTVECWGGRRVVKRDVIISDNPDAGDVSAGAFEIPRVPMRTRRVTVTDPDGDPLRSSGVSVSVGEVHIRWWEGEDGVVTYEDPLGVVAQVLVFGAGLAPRTFTTLTVPDTVQLDRDRSERVSVSVLWRSVPAELVGLDPVEVEVELRPVDRAAGAVVRRTLSTAGLPGAPDELHLGSWLPGTTVELGLRATVRPRLLPPREYRVTFLTLRLDRNDVGWVSIPDEAFDELAVAMR